MGMWVNIFFDARKKLNHSLSIVDQYLEKRSREFLICNPPYPLLNLFYVIPRSQDSLCVKIEFALDLI